MTRKNLLNTTELPYFRYNKYDWKRVILRTLITVKINKVLFLHIPRERRMLCTLS